MINQWSEQDGLSCFIIFEDNRKPLIHMSHIRSVRWGVPVRETLVLSHRLCEVVWPVPFLAAFISPVFPPGTHLLQGGQWASIQPLVLGGSRTVVFGTVGKHYNRYATYPCKEEYSGWLTKLPIDHGRHTTSLNHIIDLSRQIYLKYSSR